VARMPPLQAGGPLHIRAPALGFHELLVGRRPLEGLTLLKISPFLTMDLRVYFSVRISRP